MSAHQILAELHTVVSRGDAACLDPGSGGTLDLGGRWFSTFAAPAGTYKLPNAGLGDVVAVTAAGSVTIQDAAGNAVNTLTSGKSCLYYAKSTSTWAAIGGETEIAELYLQHETTLGLLPVPLTSITQEDGTVLAKLNSTTSGWSQLGNADVVINIPVNATVEAFSFTALSPPDLDVTQPVYVLVDVSKAADNDTLTLDCELYASAPGDYANSDLVSSSATTIVAAGSQLSFTCGAPTIAATSFSGVLTLGGTNDGDAVYIRSVSIRYTKKLLAS